MNGVVVCVLCALLLFAALVWYNTRFTTQQGMLSLAEVEVALAYIALLGWFLPLSTSASFCLFASDRVLTASVEIPRQKRRTKENLSAALRPPRYQEGMTVPFVYDQDTPWCWLEYCSGRLQGQRIAFQRAIITLGREEDNDVWLDDEQASRHHAELAWDKGEVYLTDCDSMNGVLLNGQRIRSTTLVEPGATIEICSYRFHFILAEQTSRLADSFDPLSRHVWHSTSESLTEKNEGFVPGMPSSISSIGETPPLTQLPGFLHMPSMPDIPSVRKDASFVQDVHTTGTPRTLGISQKLSSPNVSLPQTLTQEANKPQPTAPLGKIASSMQSSGRGMLFFRTGESVGKTRVLDRPLLTIGRDSECDIVLYDIAASRQHAQFVWQIDGDYVQDLSSQNGTYVNEELLTKPCLLRTGDMIRIGNMRIEYLSLPSEHMASQAQRVSLSPRPISGPGQFKLPGKS